MIEERNDSRSDILNFGNIYIYILCDIVYSGANSSNEQTGDPTGH